MATRLEILKASLEKKKAKFQERLDAHYNEVRMANGQPLNDKANGRTTLNRWEKSEEALRRLQGEIKKTEAAIEKEESKSAHVEGVSSELPAYLLDMVKEGELVQWRKYPNMFFVPGVEKARIIYDLKKGTLGYKYWSQIPDDAQKDTFRAVLKKLAGKSSK
jgi:hypothetical protein